MAQAVLDKFTAVIWWRKISADVQGLSRLRTLATTSSQCTPPHSKRSAHEPTALYPQAYLPFDACPGAKCFQFDGELEGDRAVASNTSKRVVIYRATGSSWTTEQVLRSPDMVPGGLNESIDFGSKTALSGNALLIGGTSNKYPGKQVVWVSLVVSGKRALTSVSNACCGISNATYILPPLGVLPARPPQ